MTALFSNSIYVGAEVAGVRRWNVKDQKAYGICISLYEQHPVNGKMSGGYFNKIMGLVR